MSAMTAPTPDPLRCTRCHGFKSFLTNTCGCRLWEFRTEDDDPADEPRSLWVREFEGEGAATAIVERYYHEWEYPETTVIFVREPGGAWEKFEVTVEMEPSFQAEELDSEEAL